MLPYILLYPFWVLASVFWPLFQSVVALHGKQENNDREMKVWLFYWVLYATGTFLFTIPFFETLVYVPFGVLDLFIPLYYEAQVAGVVWLVNPKVRGLDKALSMFEEKVEPHIEQLKTVVEAGVAKAKAALEGAAAGGGGAK